MSEVATSSTLFSQNEIEITRTAVQASMKDGVLLHGYCYQRTTPVARGRNALEPLSTPLLCIPSDLGNCAEYHRFIIDLLALPGAPSRVFAIDLRGRGRSIDAVARNTDPASDADDLISFCDALNLHDIDVVVSGRSSVPLFLSGPKRPALVRRLILNDAAPEYDSVGIARHTARRQRQARPGSWDEAVANLKALKGDEFPQFKEPIWQDSDWKEWARTIWRDDNGKPSPNYRPDLVRFTNAVDYDARQTTLWPEFAIFARRPMMLVRGEHSSFVSQEILERIKKRKKDLVAKEARGQGHSPLLHLGDLAQSILDFLRREP